MERQHTIARTVSCSGVGLHTGERVKLTLHAAKAGEGVRFIRTDVRHKDNVIGAHALNVSTTQLGTNLTNADGVSVATVEHLLAACSGLGLDNITAELEGPEAPIFDGSAAEFVALIEDAGVAAQDAPRRRIEVLKTVEVRDGAKFARLSPGPKPGQDFVMNVVIDFPSKAIGRQAFSFALEPGGFVREIAWARTFGFVQEVEKLRAMGKARGGSMENAIVIDGDTVLNPDGLKTPDEFVRHKLIDVIGDLYLAGGPIAGLYEAEQPGHALNNRLLRALFADDAAWRWSDAA